ncbi:hypothetical protein CIPAW_09G205800 [Carya illinoinensis]|uniref:Endonuclease/exonuclease/phosphatase domain-containing protein n=1 Tax=Carya illinoinensis TaxID=32201 RepID=A0A8T1PQ05_CARIL|nr:hypothetical protein CIPAW_09G205800 [Carya illinoinensis]
MWNRRVVELRDHLVGEFLVACHFKNLEDGFEWAFAGVYGPTVDCSRSLLWDEMLGVCRWWNLPWCFGGDFNLTHFPSEKSGESNFSHAMSSSSDLIFELNPIDLPLVGGDYTWSNGRSFSRLDRFLVSTSWEAHFSGLNQKLLPRMCSDHYPIMLDCGGVKVGRRYFKFENMRLKEEGFVDKVRS